MIEYGNSGQDELKLDPELETNCKEDSDSDVEFFQANLNQDQDNPEEETDTNWEEIGSEVSPDQDPDAKTFGKTMKESGTMLENMTQPLQVNTKGRMALPQQMIF